MPQFVGGTEALSKYVKKNNQYFSQNVTVEGKAFVSFIVTETGKITDVQIVKGLYEPCDKEALRLIENIPDWIPAEQMGRKVRTKMILPIRFNM
jgi:TonB family protein